MFVRLNSSYKTEKYLRQYTIMSTFWVTQEPFLKITGCLISCKIILEFLQNGAGKNHILKSEIYLFHMF